MDTAPVTNNLTCLLFRDGGMEEGGGKRREGIEGRREEVRGKRKEE